MRGKIIAAKSGAVFMTIMLACTFFSKSFIGYLTPKVTAARPQIGIISKELTLNGTFDAPQKSDVIVDEAKTNPIKITDVNVKRGDKVKKGDIIAMADAGETLKSEVVNAEKQVKALQLGTKDWKYQLETAVLAIEKQIALQEEQSRTLKQSLQAYEAKAKRENGTDVSMENAKSKLELAQKEYKLLKQQEESRDEAELLDTDKQINTKEDAISKMESSLAELETKLKSDPEAKYQTDKLKKDLNIARLELSALSVEYNRIYESAGVNSKRQISAKKDELNQLILLVGKLNDITNRNEEENYKLLKAQGDISIVQEELNILQNSLWSQSNSAIANIQRQIADKEDQIHSLEQKVNEGGDTVKNQTEKEKDIEKATHELELAKREMTLLRKERLQQAETNILNIKKQLIAKSDEIETLQDSASRMEGNSDTLWQIDKTNAELKLNEKELQLLINKKKELSEGSYQGKNKALLKKEIGDAEEKHKKLLTQIAALTVIKAKRDGTVAEVAVKEGDTYQGFKPICTIMPSGVLEIRAVVPKEAEEAVKVGMKCTVTQGSHSGNAKIIKITEQSNEDKLECIAIIEVEQEFFRNFSEALSLKGRDIQISISYNNGLCPAVIPNASIFQEESGKKVYLLKKREGFWGEEYYIEKVAVTLEDYNSKSSSVQGLSNETVVTGWDRTLKDKQSVIYLPD